MAAKSRKVAPFIILIVAMVLSLRAPNITMSQEAELPVDSDEDVTVTDESALQRFADDKAKYKEKLKDKNKTAAEKAEIRKDIMRINLMEKILTAKANGNMDRIPKLVEKLELTYSGEQTYDAIPIENATSPRPTSPEQLGAPPVIIQALGTYEYQITKVSYSSSGWSTTVKKFNCDIQFYSWGYSRGWSTLSNSQGTIVTFMYDYPSEFGPKGHQCNEKDHYRSIFSMYTYGSGSAAWCRGQVPDNDGRAILTSCDNTSGQAGIVITDALYGTSKNHTAEFLGVTGIIL